MTLPIGANEAWDFANLVRRAAKELLKGQTHAGDNVMISRYRPAKVSGLPLLLIYTGDDDGQGEEGAAPPQFRHRLTTVFEGILSAETDEEIDTQLDRLAAQVKRRLLQAPAFVGLFESLTRVLTQRTQQSDGEERLAGVRVSIEGTYSSIWDPRILDSLERLGLSIDVIDPAFDPNNLPGQHYDPDQPNPRRQGPDGRIEAGGVLTLPQED